MHARFKDLELDKDGLHTPNGLIPLDRVTAASLTRNKVSEGAEPGSEVANPAAVAGGAVIGGVVAGVPGAVAGGLIGSTVKTEAAGEPAYQRTVSATISFEGDGVVYSAEVPVFDVEDAEEFVGKVRKAAGIGE